MQPSLLLIFRNWIRFLHEFKPFHSTEICDLRTTKLLAIVSWGPVFGTSLNLPSDRIVNSQSDSHSVLIHSEWNSSIFLYLLFYICRRKCNLCVQYAQSLPECWLVARHPQVASLYKPRPLYNQGVRLLPRVLKRRAASVEYSRAVVPMESSLLSN